MQWDDTVGFGTAQQIWQPGKGVGGLRETLPHNGPRALTVPQLRARSQRAILLGVEPILAGDERDEARPDACSIGFSSVLLGAVQPAQDGANWVIDDDGV